jgi:hypothetical protein
MSNKYRNRVRKAREIPWGYARDPEDSNNLLPIDEQLDTLEEAKKYIKQGCTLRDTAKWLSARTGRSLSYVGLLKIIERHRSEGKAYGGAKAWATSKGLPLPVHPHKYEDGE